MSKFIHLHTHSHYSLLSALPKIPELVAAAKSDGASALALTDNGNLHGAIEFYKECKKAGIKPILGIDAYKALRSRGDKQAGIDNARSRLILLAKGTEGYMNLIKLVTASYLEGFYYKPRIDNELLEKWGSDLVCISPAWSGEISGLLKNKNYEGAEEKISFYKKLFGKENFFLEITHHPEIAGHMELMKEIGVLARKTDTPLVASQDVFYLHPEDKKAWRTLMSVQNGGDMGEKREFGGSDENFSFISGKEMEKNFKDSPDALLNIEKVSALCNLKLPLGKWLFPSYIPKSGLSTDEELRRIVYLGIKNRGLPESKEVLDRIEYELGIILQKGYAPYFLVVGDLLRFAHEQKILTTIRGSVAGSIVTYLAYITNVNPLEYKLPFERFLNPERPSAPDIDMDFADNRRDEVIEYAKKKYGYDKVAQIGTFGTMMARGAVRDVTRALGYPYALGDTLAKMIPMGSQGFPMTLDRALEIVPELTREYERDAKAKEIIDIAKKIEGCARHISVHAAGVVISPIPLTDVVPLQYDTKGENKIITQYDMYSIDEDNAGLLKFDFLGIKNLSILAEAVENANQKYGTSIDIEKIPIDDKKTFELLAKGETAGLFQLNGTGMTAYLKQLKPTSILDINAMVALYRPGPMESIPQYIERKHNPMLVTYLDPRLKDILSQSYGVITYQDDVLMTSIKLGGFTWLEADKLRKAMGKKIPREMEAQKEKLLEGLVKNGMSQTKANTLWKLIEPFAAYGFGKAHAASYGRVAYQTAYMKANFPAVYMSSVLSADSGDVEKIGEIIAECKRMEIPVLPPDINESASQFTVVGDLKEGVSEKIRFGLTTIKNFGEGIADIIIGERGKNGKFKSLADFLERIKDRNLNKKSLEALVKCGAMDAFGERGEMLGNIEGLLSYNKENKLADNHNSLFGDAEIHTSFLKLNPMPPAAQNEKLTWEKELLGLYISGHPLDHMKEKLEKQGNSIKKIKEGLKEGMVTVVAGIIEEIRPLLTKNGEQMLFIRLADYTGSIETVVFPRVFSEYKALLRPEACVAFKAKFSLRNDTPSLIVEKVKAL
ncbi:MAG: DNA polymerase III subunit alpha [Candidatus Taylorbacteria bacterium]